MLPLLEYQGKPIRGPPGSSVPNTQYMLFQDDIYCMYKAAFIVIATSMLTTEFNQPAPFECIEKLQSFTSAHEK